MSKNGQSIGDNWDDCRYYLAVARSGTVAAAEKLLDVNHSTVLRRIDTLETAPGAKLSPPCKGTVRCGVRMIQEVAASQEFRLRYASRKHITVNQPFELTIADQGSINRLATEDFPLQEALAFVSGVNYPRIAG